MTLINKEFFNKFNLKLIINEIYKWKTLLYIEIEIVLDLNNL